MLLINGTPVHDDFLKDYAAIKKKTIIDFHPQKTTSFKLSDSYFRIVRQREMKSGRLTERTLVSPEFSIEATYDWYNPFTGMRAKLTYAQNYQPDDSGRNRNPINQVAFEYGFITVSPEETDLYFWLLNHPLNQTNPKYLDDENQKPPKPFMFRELLPDRESTAFLDHEKLVAKATLLLTEPSMKGYVNDEALKALAKSYGYGSVLNSGRKDLEKFLISFVKKHPAKVMDDLTSAATEIRAVLADAVQYGVIKFDLPYVKYMDVSKGKRTINNGIIVQCPNGLDPMDYFVNWMREKDNSGVYNQLKKELDDKKLAEIDAAQG